MEKTHRDMTEFTKSIQSMIATSDGSYNVRQGYGKERVRFYTPDEIKTIISGNSSVNKKELSRAYFYSNSYYRRVILFYSTLLTYVNVLIPRVKVGTLADKKNKNTYLDTLDFIENLHIKDQCTRFTAAALVDGAYYGMVVKKNNNYSFLDLPFEYCRTRFKGFSGLDVVEFDITYFTTIHADVDRKAALALYPKNVQTAYHKYLKGTSRQNKWVMIPEGTGVYFSILEEIPFFINAIPEIDDFERYKNLEIQKEELETKKILVQRLPIDNQGDLIFEPDEGAELHRGAVAMLKNNKTLDVLTTYATVELESLSESSQAVNSNLETFRNLVYSSIGVSPNLFAASGNLSLDQSIKNDLALVMILGEKYNMFFTNLIKEHNNNKKIDFNFMILPVTYYNSEEYIENAYKLATVGYSFLIPAIASGISQKNLVNIKELENSLLDLKEVLIPLSSTYTETENSEGGNPGVDDTKKTDKTIQNTDGGKS